MKAEDKYNQIISELRKNNLYELFYIPLLVIAIIIVKMIGGKEMFDQYDTVIFLLAFGLFHVFASNILSFLYNLNWVISPIALKASPKVLKIVGMIITGISCFMGISYIR